MQAVIILLIGALTFGACYFFDKGFERIFRSRSQHRSGLAVRANKRYGAFGAVLTVLGIAAILAGLGETLTLTIGGVIVAAVGIGMAVYYVSFGVYYDEDTFLLSGFGRKSTVYSYRDIRSQQLYNASGNILIELHLADGRTVGLQAGMTGVYAFLDTAFAGWCRQTGRREADCPFHDPSKSCWFPATEDA